MAEEAVGSVDALLCSFLMLLCMFAAYLTKKFQFIYLPESASALLLGMVFGAVSKFCFDGKSLRFDPLVFFYGLLPIIIFNAGYSLKKKDFFQNFTTIVLFAVVGTIISALVYGLCTYFLVLSGLITHMSSESPLLESLMFGSLISAIDPVATLSIFQDIAVPTALYNLVLGESLVNDAVAIVLFHTFVRILQLYSFQCLLICTVVLNLRTFYKELSLSFFGLIPALLHLPSTVQRKSFAMCRYMPLTFWYAVQESFLDQEFTFSTIGIAIVQFCVISVASIGLGFGVSLVCALILKNIDSHKEFCKFELAFILLSAYIAYAMADIMGLSGIMALFFCGICNSHYGYYNTSQSSKISSKYTFEALAFIAEVFVFAYLGMQVVFLQHQLDAGLLISAIPLCLLSRAINIFPLSWVANKGRTWPISNPMKVMMWMCGLRGPIAYALCVNMPTKNGALETTTLFIVVTTTLIFGISTGPLIKSLGLTPDVVGSENIPILGHRGGVELLEGRGRTRSTPHRLFKWVDKAYLKPIFGGRTEGDLYEPCIDRGSEQSGDSDGAREVGVEVLSDDDESFKYPDVTLFEMPPPVRPKSGPHQLLEENGALPSSKFGSHPLLQ